MSVGAIAANLRAAQMLARSELALTPGPQRHDYMTQICIETGGTLILPAESPSGLAEISVLGISATGHTIDAAIVEWIQAEARSQIGGYDAAPQVPALNKATGA